MGRDAQPDKQPMELLPEAELCLAGELALALASGQKVLVLVDYLFSQVPVGTASRNATRNNSFSAVAVLIRDSHETTAEALERIMSIVDWSITSRWARDQGLRVGTL